MKFLNNVIRGFETVTKYLKLFQCIEAGLEAFTTKAKELNLLSNAATNSTDNKE